MKIITIVGSRPQFIKAAVVSRAIATFNSKNNQPVIQELLIHTGQHYDYNMSDIFFEEMQIPAPTYHLGVGNCSHGEMTGRMLEKIEQIIIGEHPDIVLVYGDTNSTLAGALAAIKLHTPVAHVESGLRSFNMKMPEEVNRILTDHVSSLLFCSNDNAVNNLKNEGFFEKEFAKILNVGDVMYDAFLMYRDTAKPRKTLETLIHELPDNFYLATVHRAENTDSLPRLSNIIKALDIISKKNPVVMPLHPRTRKQLTNQVSHNFKLIEPVGYFEMMILLSRCNAVFTDSGGLQKEAYFFKKPCITLRDETEWVELIHYGFNILAGSDKDKILESAEKLNDLNLDWQISLYGDGNAGAKIVQALSESS